MQRFRQRFGDASAVVLTCSLAFAACGGEMPSGGGSHAPRALAPNAAARATLQSTFVAYEWASAWIAASPGATVTLSKARRTAGAGERRPLASAPPCIGGTASSGPVSNPDGTTTFSSYWYYDQGCTQIREVKITTNGAGSNPITTVTSTTYDRSGNVTAYTATTESSASGMLTDVTTLARAAGAPWFAKTALTCAGVAGLEHCGAAAVATAGGTQVGVAVDDVTSFVTGLLGAPSSASATVTAYAYAAPSGLDVAPGTAPAWTVTGASPPATLSGSATLTANAGITGGSMSLADRNSGIAVNGAFARSSYMFVVTQNGTQLATATIDGAGDGRIIYADGTTDTVTGYLIG